MLHIEPILAGPYEENAYLVYLDGRDDALVVDPGDQAGLIQSRAQAAGRTITHVLVTHGHFDHILAAHDLQQAGAKLLCHELDAHMLLDPAPLKLPGSAAPKFHPTQVDEALAEGPLSVCGIDFALLHTPGHSMGSCCYHAPEHSALLSGDTLFAEGFGRTDFQGGSAQKMRDSLLRLFRLPGDTMVYPGHGPCARMDQIVGRYRL